MAGESIDLVKRDLHQLRPTGVNIHDYN
jgi:hypothetical protein